MAPAPGALSARRAVHRGCHLAAVSGALVLAALPVRGVAVVVSLVLALGVLVDVRRRAADRGQETTVWRWFGRAAGLLAGGLAVELGIAVVALVTTGEGRAGGVGPPAGVAVSIGAALASPALYEGLVHWNRYRTRVSDPADWLNGLAAVIALVAIGLAALDGAGSPIAGWSAWVLVPWLVQGAALVILTGTAFTIIGLGGLAHDARSWIVAGALAAASGIQLAVAALSGGTAAEVAVSVARATAVSWTVAMMGILVAACMGARRISARQASSGSTTGGALVVLVAVLSLAVRNAFVADEGVRLSTTVAAVAALIAMVRLLLVVSDLAQLALSRLEARTDDLTGVPNRRHLMEVLEALGPAAASLVLIDLERFKEVNDRFGHAAGDEVIRIAATRLHDSAAGRGTLARLGGDEFALVLPGMSLIAAADVARVLLEHLAEPLEVRGETVRIGASIGVAETSGGAGNEDLMRRADAAMYRAKRAGGGVRLYDEAADTAARAERRLLADLRVLLADAPAHDHDGSAQDVGELVVHYQPMLDVRTRTPVAVEALVRWAHPVRGLLPPPEFLDLVEEHGLMDALTARVLDTAVREVASWHGPGADVRLSVNLSGSCLESADLVEVVSSTLQRHGFPGGRLVMEITETTVVLDDAGAIAAVERLAALGVTLSIDDYGTGYSSLARVLAFPTEELKLDRSFTLRVTCDDRTAALVAGTIDFAHRLGLRVVAEGVENEATFDAVAAIGCDVTQGYLHSRPLPAEAVRTWLAATTVP